MGRLDLYTDPNVQHRTVTADYLEELYSIIASQRAEIASLREQLHRLTEEPREAS